MKRIRLDELVAADDDADAPKKRKGNPKFVKGMKPLPGAGRKPGVPNKINRLVKESIVEAVERLGSDRKGKDGMVGWLMKQANRYPVAYMRLLDRLLPYELTGKGGGPVQLEYRSKADIVERLKERGLPVPKSLMAAPPSAGETKH